MAFSQIPGQAPWRDSPKKLARLFALRGFNSGGAAHRERS